MSHPTVTDDPGTDAADVAPVLSFDAVTVGHFGVPAVRELSMDIRPGEICAMLGPNGAGKTTTLLAAVGALPVMSGRITALGRPIDEHVERNARRGVTLVPDNRGLFHRLSVTDNLRLARRKGGGDIDEVYEHFPRLRDLRGRRCGNLSGGEQQMLALAKALLTRPSVLLIDELSLGLSPVAVQDLLPRLRTIADQQNMAVVLVEQHIDLALGIADTAVVLHHGRVALKGSARDLMQRRDTVEAAYFGRLGESGPVDCSASGGGNRRRSTRSETAT